MHIQPAEAAIKQTAPAPFGWLAGLLVMSASTLLWFFHAQNTVDDALFNWANQYPAWHPLRYVPKTMSFLYTGLAQLVIFAMPFIIVELWSKPERRNALHKAYLLPLMIWAVFLFLGLSAIFIGLQFRRLLGIPPLLDGTQLPDWLHVIVWIILVDFTFYWYHRLEHHVPLLWKIHATHHSLTELNALNHYGHWIEDFTRFFLVTLPVSLMIATPPQHASIIALIYTSWSIYLHSDTRALQMPAWTRGFFVDNRFHHFHHGVAAEHHNSNYAQMFAFWDRMFGTYHLPDGHDFPKTGLADVPPPRKLSEYLWHPFRQGQ